jgi:hypothetical protein
MNLANRVLISCKTSRPTLFQAKLTGLAVIPMGISGAAMRLMSPRRLSGEYSRGKVPNVLANSRVHFFDSTGLLTPRPLLTRDSESFGARFRGAEGTLRVPLGPRLVSLETESRGGRLDPTQSLA